VDNATSRFVEALFAEHADTVYRYCRVRLGADDAADAVSEVFVVAWRRADEIPDRPIAWLLGVARHVVANQLRSRRRAAALRFRLLGDDDRAAPDHAALIAGSDAALRALRALSPGDQQVITLMMAQPLSLEELGTALGCSAKTASVRLSRARARLRRAVEAEELADAATRPPSVPVSTRPVAAETAEVS
jgi:RNA polymerase sigma-70 factor (ECF subfamily)